MSHRSLQIIRLGLIGLLLVWLAPVMTSLLRPTLIGNTHNSEKVLASSVSSTKDQLIYSQLGITVPIETQSSANPFAYESWNSLRASLYRGVSLVHSPFPEDKNTYYIIGHSSDRLPHRYSAVFAGLNQSQSGDVFQLSLNGQRMTFTVVDKQRLNPTDKDAFARLSNTDEKKERVILITCWPVFTTKERLAIVGERSLN